jgi:hypothetical protein
MIRRLVLLTAVLGALALPFAPMQAQSGSQTPQKCRVPSGGTCR